jgi:hypothetical protein
VEVALRNAGALAAAAPLLLHARVSSSGLPQRGAGAQAALPWWANSVFRRGAVQACSCS